MNEKEQLALEQGEKEWLAEGFKDFPKRPTKELINVGDKV